MLVTARTRGWEGGVGLRSIGELPGAEGVFVQLHIDAIAGEDNAFELEPCALLAGGRSRQLDRTTGAYDALPGKLIRRIGAQQPGYGAVVPGVACGGGYPAVSADTSGRDGEDDAAEGAVALAVGGDRRVTACEGHVAVGPVSHCAWEPKRRGRTVAAL